MPRDREWEAVLSEATSDKSPARAGPTIGAGGGFKGFMRATEIDTRMLGMIGALLVIWVGFHILSGGTFLTPRNLWNLSVQTASVGVMATGSERPGGVGIISRSASLTPERAWSSTAATPTRCRRPPTRSSAARARAPSS